MSNKENSIKVKEGEMEVTVLEEKTIEKKVTEILSNLGIPRNIMGFHYLRRALIISINYKNSHIPMTKVLYPQIAKECKTTSSRVERAIRHAIEVAWSRGDYEYIYKLFVNTISDEKGKPTNSEFIALVTDELRLKMK